MPDTSTGIVLATLRNTVIGFHRTGGHTTVTRATPRTNRHDDLIVAITQSNLGTQ